MIKSKTFKMLIFFFILDLMLYAAPAGSLWSHCARVFALIQQTSIRKTYPSYMERILSDRTTPEGHQVIVFTNQDGTRCVEIRVPGKPPENFTITNRGLEDLRSGSQGDGRAYPRELIDPQQLSRQDVLDVGCGAGTFVRDLARISKEAGQSDKKKVGVDPFLDDSQLSDSAHFQEGRAENMASLPDATFDTVFSNYSVFLYNARPDSYLPALREMCRVTKVGGRIRISPCEPRFIIEALQELPDLQLDPRIEIGSSPDSQMRWNGSSWDGEPFVELIRVR